MHPIHFNVKDSLLYQNLLLFLNHISPGNPVEIHSFSYLPAQGCNLITLYATAIATLHQKGFSQELYLFNKQFPIEFIKRPTFFDNDPTSYSNILSLPVEIELAISPQAGYLILKSKYFNVKYNISLSTLASTTWYLNDWLYINNQSFSDQYGTYHVPSSEEFEF